MSMSDARQYAVCYFNLDVKVVCNGLDWMLTDSEFHTVGAVKQKDRLANSDWMYAGNVKQWASRRAASWSGRDVTGCFCCY